MQCSTFDCIITLWTTLPLLCVLAWPESIVLIVVRFWLQLDTEHQLALLMLQRDLHWFVVMPLTQLCRSLISLVLTGSVAIMRCGVLP